MAGAPGSVYGNGWSVAATASRPAASTARARLDDMRGVGRLSVGVGVRQRDRDLHAPGNVSPI